MVSATSVRVAEMPTLQAFCRVHLHGHRDHEPFIGVDPAKSITKKQDVGDGGASKVGGMEMKLQPMTHRCRVQKSYLLTAPTLLPLYTTTLICNNELNTISGGH